MARILLVEDEMLVRELAFEDLSDAGHEVVAAGSGERALEILSQDRDFDLLLTDIRMPGSVDGWQLASEAKVLVPGVKVIYSTGLGESAEHLDQSERLAVKPYNSKVLVELVRELLAAQ